MSNNSAADQRARLLTALRHRSVTTVQARRDLDIMMPAARVHELRHREGFDISTVWCDERTECGAVHRVARYVLKTGGA